MSGHALAHDGMHRMFRRADKSSTAAATTTKGATTTKASTTTAVDKVSVAPTSTASPSVPTTPPTSTKATSSVALSSYASSSANVDSNYSPAVASSSASASQSTASAQPVLSEGALIGIIAGAGALGVIVFAMLFWWCWKSRKAKREQAQWWKLDAVGKEAPGNHGVNDSGRHVNSDPWAKPVGDSRRQGDNDTWGTKPGASGRGEKEKEWSTTPGAGGAQYGQYASQPTTPAAPTPTARELLLGIGAAAPAAKKGRNTRESPLDVSVQSTASSTLPPYSGNNPSPFNSPDDPPQRPLRPSVVPDAKDDAAALSPKARNRQSMMVRSNKKDTIMNFADAYGDTADAGWGPIPPSPTSPNNSSIVPPKRGASIRATGARAAPPDAPRPPLPASSPEAVDSFPPRPRERTRDPSQSQYGRVDSKPLRELEDILDSFGHSSIGALPPVPEAEGLRASTASTTTPPRSGPSPVTSLMLTRSPRSPTSEGPLILPSSYSTTSLSPTSALPPLRQPQAYALNHHPVSIYSTQGDVGELQSSQPNSPSKAAYADPSSGWSPERPHPPTTSSGHAHQFMGSNNDEFNSQSSLVFSSTQLDFPLPSPVSTQFVRKISLKKTEAPMRMTREESVRRRREENNSPSPSPSSSSTGPTKAERDIVAQMGFDTGHGGSPALSSRSSSPPQTPRDFDFGPLASSKAQAHDALAGTGFVPLSAMTLDVGANNYRSATESIYGLYDDLPPDLLGLPRDDPRVSRHISMYGLATR